MIEECFLALEKKAYSPRTIEATRQVLKGFIAHLEERKTLSQVTEEDLEEYALLIQRTKSQATLRYVLVQLRRFYRTAFKEQLLLNDPSQHLPKTKGGNALPKHIPSEDAVRLLLDRPDEFTYEGIRDRAILELLYSSALRNTELRNLNVDDVDLKENTVHVREGKGRKGRLVPLGEKARQAIQKYLEVTRPKRRKEKSESFLFLTSRGQKIAKNTLSQILRKYALKSNLTKDITPHILRHACALHMLRGGASPSALQKLLGHKHLQTVEIYTRLCPKDLKIAHRKFHPRSSMRSSC